MKPTHFKVRHLRRAVLVAIAALAVGAPPSSAQARELEGTVVSVNRAGHTFRLRDSERGTIRVRVTSRTRFERIRGFSGLRSGLRNVEAMARRANGRWLAVKIEASGGGGSHSDSDDGAGDDRGRGRGSDD